MSVQPWINLVLVLLLLSALVTSLTSWMLNAPSGDSGLLPM
jgi:hypothetical protein